MLVLLYCFSYIPTVYNIGMEVIWRSGDQPYNWKTDPDMLVPGDIVDIDLLSDDAIILPFIPRATLGVDLSTEDGESYHRYGAPNIGPDEFEDYDPIGSA